MPKKGTSQRGLECVVSALAGNPTAGDALTIYGSRVLHGVMAELTVTLEESGVMNRAEAAQRTFALLLREAARLGEAIGMDAQTFSKAASLSYDAVAQSVQGKKP